MSKLRTTKKLDKVQQRIGRLIESSRGIGQHYDIELIAEEAGQNAVTLRYTCKPKKGSAMTHPGVYCLRSSETDWDEEKLWRTCVMLTDLEAVFKSLKSELGMRPVYYHKEERTDGHLFITVLAYQFVQILRRRLLEHNITGSWNSLRTAMRSQVRVTATFQRTDGRALHVRKATQPEGRHFEICNALGLDTQPGGVIKTIY